ncbi:MAG TPA: hypothetical protein PKG48_08525, partial [Bacteroidales bacterium]|nr:hypothetical protein [Bacteroidales bacterium]
MRKKSIYLENELVQELRKKIAHGYSGDIIDGFFFFLNKNIEILKRENVIFENVQQIRELKNGVLEHGDFTRDIIKNAIMREPYQGKRKLIKALIIATFGEDWVPVYNKYFTKDGDQLESVIEEVSSYGQEKVTL